MTHGRSWKRGRGLVLGPVLASDIAHGERGLQGFEEWHEHLRVQALRRGHDAVHRPDAQPHL